MEEIARLAQVAVSRGCHFANLAITTLMGGLGFNPVIAVKTGAIGLLVTAIVLVLKAMFAHRIDPRSTEVWCLIDPTPRMQTLCKAHVGAAMRQQCLEHGYAASAFASGLFALAFVLDAVL
jgi:hypothetical protein